MTIITCLVFAALDNGNVLCLCLNISQTIVTCVKQSSNIFYILSKRRFEFHFYLSLGNLWDHFEKQSLTDLAFITVSPKPTQLRDTITVEVRKVWPPTITVTSWKMLSFDPMLDKSLLSLSGRYIKFWFMNNV